MTWNHNSGFNVHVRGRRNGSDGDAIENAARYMSRAAISVGRVEFNPDKNSVAVYERQYRSLSDLYTTYTIYGQFFREHNIGRILKDCRPKGLRPGTVLIPVEWMAKINLQRFLRDTSHPLTNHLSIIMASTLQATGGSILTGQQ